MATYSTGYLGDIPRKSPSIRFRSSEHVEAKPDPKPLAADWDAWKQKHGRAIERALELAGMTKQFASDRMGYPVGDQSAISKWIAGVERPQMEKLLAIEELRPWLVIAQAEVFGLPVETTIAVRRGA